MVDDPASAHSPPSFTSTLVPSHLISRKTPTFVADLVTAGRGLVLASISASSRILTPSAIPPEEGPGHNWTAKAAIFNLLHPPNHRPRIFNFGSLLQVARENRAAGCASSARSAVGRG